MKQFKDDNSGLSLIEVLIAMVILAIVVTPFLHSFVTTTSANTKARRMQRATVLAQSVMEGLKAGPDVDKLSNIAVQFNYPAANDNWQLIEPTMVSAGTNYRVGEYRYDSDTNTYVSVVKKEDIESTLPNIKEAMVNNDLHASVYPETLPGGGVNYELLPSADKKYYFMINDLEMDQVKYDVLITLDGSSANAQHYNSEELYQLPIMDESQDAICIQKEEYTADALDACNVSNVNRLAREIRIDVDYTTDSGSERTVVTATYHYSNVSDSSKIYENKVVCYDSAQTGNPLRAIYLYYTPLYPSYWSDYDVIRYVNNDNYPVTLNIFKQKTNYLNAATDTTEGKLAAANAVSTSATAEQEYRMQLIIQSDAAGNFNNLKTQINTNLYSNLGDPNQPAGDNYVIQFKTPTSSRNIDLKSSNVLEKKKEERVYDADVSIYSSDAIETDGTFDFSDDKKLADFTGSILD